MADATDLKSVDRKVVWVRLPPSAPIISIAYKTHHFSLSFRHGVNSVANIVFVQIAEEIAAHVVADSPSSIRLGTETSINLVYRERAELKELDIGNSGH